MRGVTLEFPAKVGKDLRYALYREVYELPEARAIAALLEPGDRILELGTAIGYVAIECARRVGDKSVFTIEANPEIAEVARRNFARNGVAPTLIEGLAVAGPAAARREFFVYDDFWASSETRREEPGSEREIECAAIDVNALIREKNINALICDIEGAEIALIHQLDLAPLNKLVIEFHPGSTGDDAVRIALARLLAAGFAPVIHATSDCTIAMRRSSPATGGDAIARRRRESRGSPIPGSIPTGGRRARGSAP